MYDDPAFHPEVEEQQDAAIPATAVSEAPTAPTGINFHNTVAVRVGFLAAGIVTLLLSFPMPPVFALIWYLVMLLAGGFFSVYLYAKRTGTPLSVGSGARMGWITGVFCFAITTVIFTGSLLLIASGDGLASFFREAANSRGTTPEVAEQINAVLQSNTGLAAILISVLMLFFFMMTLIAAVGGALGAKVLEKE